MSTLLCKHTSLSVVPNLNLISSFNFFCLLRENISSAYSSLMVGPRICMTVSAVGLQAEASQTFSMNFGAEVTIHYISSTAWMTTRVLLHHLQYPPLQLFSMHCTINTDMMHDGVYEYYCRWQFDSRHINYKHHSVIFLGARRHVILQDTINDPNFPLSLTDGFSFPSLAWKKTLYVLLIIEIWDLFRCLRRRGNDLTRSSLIYFESKKRT